MWSGDPDHGHLVVPPAWVSLSFCFSFLYFCAQSKKESLVRQGTVRIEEMQHWGWSKSWSTPCHDSSVYQSINWWNSACVQKQSYSQCCEEDAIPTLEWHWSLCLSQLHIPAVLPALWSGILSILESEGLKLYGSRHEVCMQASVLL